MRAETTSARLVGRPPPSPPPEYAQVAARELRAIAGTPETLATDCPGKIEKVLRDVLTGPLDFLHKDSIVGVDRLEGCPPEFAAAIARLAANVLSESGTVKDLRPRLARLHETLFTGAAAARYQTNASNDVDARGLRLRFDAFKNARLLWQRSPEPRHPLLVADEVAAADRSVREACAKLSSSFAVPGLETEGALRNNVEGLRSALTWAERRLDTSSIVRRYLGMTSEERTKDPQVFAVTVGAPYYSMQTSTRLKDWDAGIVREMNAFRMRPTPQAANAVHNKLRLVAEALNQSYTTWPASQPIKKAS